MGEALYPQLERNLEALKDQFVENTDIIVKKMVNRGAGLRLAAIYIQGIVDHRIMNRDVIQPLLAPGFGLPKDDPDGLPSVDLICYLTEEYLPVGGIIQVDTFDMLLEYLFRGFTIVLLDGYGRGLAANTTGGEKRNVEEPSSQTVIRGPKEGFAESLRVNLSLIRRRIKSPQLSSELMRIGNVTQTDIALVYIKGIAKEETVDEVRRRLGSIDTDSILESNYIEEFIQDSTLSPFPTIINTERPDAAAAGLLEGQVVVIVDGSPFVLLAPVPFVSFFQASEDYYARPDIATFLRVIRFASYFISMMLPAVYIATTTFHQEMLPTPLLISLAAQREGVPFPAIIEALLMELTFEVLREAGVRMPRAIGPAISIVGALVLGQAAVSAGLVSAAMVIVVSFTAISNFVIPSISMSISARLLRFTMMILAGTFGLFGIMSGLMIILIHMTGLRSMGVPYLSPLTPTRFKDMKDILIRFPLNRMSLRPTFLTKPSDRRRQGKPKKPPKPGDNAEGGSPP
ncbi:spore germination protein [Gorillibacterium sp. sgz5001074]|uniref:spore germination protein n=1 Tax=Gorillibacterium sp. sgz5001074 TaxID=3446695 RepID=UPI003F674DBB